MSQDEVNAMYTVPTSTHKHNRNTETYAEVKYSHSFLLRICGLSAYSTLNGRTLPTFTSKDNAALIFSSLYRRWLSSALAVMIPMGSTCMNREAG